MGNKKNYDFEITKDSLEAITHISNNMEGKTFHLHTHLLYDIRTSIGNKLATYLEIGSFAGGSISLVSSHRYPTRCFSVDIGYPISQDVVERNVLKFKNNDSSFFYFKGDSRNPELINQVCEKIRSVDILFIDGDHSKEAVLSDFSNYSNLVKNGGYIIFDDYLDNEFSPEVNVAVNEIVKKIKNTEYDIIGSISYDLLSNFTSMKANSLFIIKKL